MIQLSANANEVKVFNAHAAPLGLCDNLVNTLKLLANQQKDGDSPIESIVTGLHDMTVPEAVVRESADELTLRAEEVGSLRTFIDTKHIELERCGPLLVGRPFAKELKDKNGKSCTTTTKSWKSKSVSESESGSERGGTPMGRVAVPGGRR